MTSTTEQHLEETMNQAPSASASVNSMPSKREIGEFFEMVRKQEKRRKELMPNEAAAIDMFFQSWQRLKELGWQEAIYSPKDGSTFEAIEPGSTGIHQCLYMGEWPKGGWWVQTSGDLWPSRPALFRKTV